MGRFSGDSEKWLFSGSFRVFRGCRRKAPPNATSMLTVWLTTF
jgi:hypothetical protein